MKTTNRPLRHALVTGSSASLLSTLALACSGRRETGSATAPTNAISHWIWGDRAARHDEASLRHTAVGYAIHHAASVFWALLYERWYGDRVARGDVRGAAIGAATVAVLACVVDYTITPHRLRPGYEMRLSRRSLVAVYAAVAAGLFAGALLRPRP